MGQGLHPTVLVFILFSIHLISFCFASNLFDQLSDQQAPGNQGFVCKQNRQERSVTNKDTEISSTKISPYKKWQVGRVSRKQYEIVNMLWRRTKYSANVESTTTPLGRQEPTNGHKSKLVARAIQQSSTPSYIEFYYFDENEDPIKHKNFSIYKAEKVLKNDISLNLEKEIPKTHPLIAFHMNDPINTRIPYYYKPHLNRKIQSKSHEFLLDVLMQSHNSTKFGYVLKPLRLVDLFNNSTWLGKKLVTVKVYLNGSRVMKTKQTLKFRKTETSTRSVEQISESRPSTTYTNSASIRSSRSRTKSTIMASDRIQSRTKSTMASDRIQSRTKSTMTSDRIQSRTKSTMTSDRIQSRTESTMANDKIKFFEMYDRHTLAPKLRKNKNVFKNDDDEKSSQPKDLKNNLENVDQNNGHYNSKNKLKYEKKHVSYDSFTTTQKLSTLSEVQTENIARLKQIYTRTSSIFKKSTMPSWSSYPFVAVYVYKPTQTHCDAAGVSAHWLLAAGSCLSRHKLTHSIQARSAYVTYCGVSWRRPERIAYVKQSLVHPKFHPRDKVRRLNYNIGLIQVSSSMESSCPNWSPIPLMSHQFAAIGEGSIVSALGWGLDRYGTQYTERLPQTPLMLYEGLVYSDMCPGSLEYSKANRQEDDIGANNIYCLLLPPYSEEEEDPVHGGLLLDGGKLIGLYLQEERRRWGAQSAQYTGVWRLIPWVMDVAREPENADAMFPEL